MSAPGRNDPCPCGSGAKFKRCCGAPATGTPLGEAQRERSLTRVMDHLGGPLGQPILTHVFEHLLEPTLDRLQTLGRPHDTVLELFAVDHAVADWRDANDRSLVECMRADGVALDAVDVEYLTALAASTRSLHLVQRNDAQSLILNDLWRDRRIVVERRIGERSLAPGTLFVARVLQGADQPPRIEGPTTSLPASSVRAILDDLTRACADAPVNLTEDRFLKTRGARALLRHELAEAARLAAGSDPLAASILRASGR